MAALFDSLFKKNKTIKSDTAKRVIGVDIGKTSIKVVELENRDGVISLTTYGEIQTAPYANAPIGESTSLTAQQEKEAVVDLLRESAVQAKRAVYAVPLTSSFVTIMSLQTLEDVDDISAQVQVEARKYIPVPIKDVTLDWAEITPEKKADDIKKVLLAAIQNSTLDRLQNLMSSTSMPKQPTEIECFSLIRSVAGVSDTTSAVLDIGGNSSKLYVTRGGLLEQIHRMYVGGATATKNISEALSIPFEDAELEKRSFNKNHTNKKISAVHNETFTRSLKEFKEVLDAYEEEHETAVTKVVLSGGTALFFGLKEYVAEYLGRDVVLARPFARVAYPAFMEDVAEDIGPSFAVALGAALRQYD